MMPHAWFVTVAIGTLTAFCVVLWLHCEALRNRLDAHERRLANHWEAIVVLSAYANPEKADVYLDLLAKLGGEAGAEPPEPPAGAGAAPAAP